MFLFADVLAATSPLPSCDRTRCIPIQADVHYGLKRDGGNNHVIVASSTIIPLLITYHFVVVDCGLFYYGGGASL